MRGLKGALQNDLDFPETSVISLILDNWNLRNLELDLWVDLHMLLDQREKYAQGIELDHQKGVEERVSKKLLNLTKWSGRPLPCDSLLDHYNLSRPSR